jgi:hypothetical protein
MEVTLRNGTWRHHQVLLAGGRALDLDELARRFGGLVADDVDPLFRASFGILEPLLARARTRPRADWWQPSIISLALDW